MIDATFLNKPLVTDDLDKPSPKKAYDPKADAKKQERELRARRWSESIKATIELPLRSSNHS